MCVDLDTDPDHFGECGNPVSPLVYLVESSSSKYQCGSFSQLKCEPVQCPSGVCKVGQCSVDHCKNAHCAGTTTFPQGPSINTTPDCRCYGDTQGEGWCLPPIANYPGPSENCDEDSDCSVPGEICLKSATYCSGYNKCVPLSIRCDNPSFPSKKFWAIRLS